MGKPLWIFHKTLTTVNSKAMDKIMINKKKLFPVVLTKYEPTMLKIGIKAKSRIDGLKLRF